MKTEKSIKTNDKNLHEEKDDPKTTFDKLKKTFNQNSFQCLLTRIRIPAWREVTKTG